VLWYYGQHVEALRTASMESETLEGGRDGMGGRRMHTEADKERKEEHFWEGNYLSFSGELFAGLRVVYSKLQNCVLISP
jgi:hypothetical protein